MSRLLLESDITTFIFLFVLAILQDVISFMLTQQKKTELLIRIFLEET